MSRQRYPEEFKIEAVKQVTEKGKPVADVAQRLGMSVHSLYAWIKVYSKPQEQRQQDDTYSCCVRALGRRRKFWPRLLFKACRAVLIACSAPCNAC
ncbi:transposase family protein, truncated (plasmid) [Pseudomonas savastanoi pv. phaseolicola 1448A]|uniref:Transposase n=9 Tax=Pseudomonas syringae group TaxID=136849 RepID=A0A2K4WSJ0_PSESX|nr:transposase family protein, truncated [Pseudomonas savastanoi pv. phaseolicola 1448A]EFW79514.1 transposase family protein, truncated [Pseudomonas savastanoi pv. glycinea str. B076]EFW85521.1 transposase family protein, truncated [Pseudomonas savastanoi pv. glycinea str. race 4]EGH05247.1 transposase family protein [Pseudomonas amygdali pv. aesculi str. 0893_23]KPW70914.1 ISEhe3 orfA [Pseudomonas amygdali pv. ciccaronei]KPX09674.1 ISEhe3 orfA [Pseudomonas syringae pv. cunninghamiae]KPX1373